MSDERQTIATHVSAQISRRGALALSVGALSVGALSTGALSIGAASVLGGSLASAATLELDNPADARLIYRKIRYRVDSGLNFWWIKGPFMAENGSDVTPMYALNSGVIQRITQRPDGGFDVRDLEIDFYTDIATGRRLSEFHNPITGETVPVPLPPGRPYLSSYSYDNVPSAPAVVGGARFELVRHPSPPERRGDDICFLDRTQAKITAPGKRTQVLNEISTLSGPREQVLDPEVKSVDARLVSNDLLDWPGWLKMGDHPGVLALYATGAKVRRLSDLPTDWKDMMTEAMPALAKDPAGAVDLPGMS